MRLSKTVTETALLLKRYTPRLYASIRNNAPPRLRSIVNERMTVDSLGTGDAELVFTNIFRQNWWNNGESRSGWGAELRRTVSIRASLPDFVQRHSISSLLDAPCGDFHWMQYVEWPSGFRYVGGRHCPRPNRREPEKISRHRISEARRAFRPPACGRWLACARPHDSFSGSRRYGPPSINSGNRPFATSWQRPIPTYGTTLTSDLVRCGT